MPLAVFTGHQFMTPSTYAATVAATGGIVSHWRFGESGGTIADDAVGANDLTYSGGFTLSQSGAISPQTDTAVLFDGINAQAKVGVAVTSATNNFACEAWIYPTALPQNSALAIYVGTDAAGWGFGIGDGTGGSGSKLVGLYGTVAWLDSGTTLSVNTWYHVVMTRDAGTTKFYVNRVQSPNTFATTPNAPVTQTSVGAENGARYFKGVIDEPAVYNAVVSLATAQAHYDSGRGTFTFPAHPISILLDSLDVTASVVMESIHINLTSSGNGSCEFTMRDPTYSITVREWGYVVITDHGQDKRLFDGYVTAPESEPFPGGPGRQLNVSCVSNSILLDARIPEPETRSGDTRNTGVRYLVTNNTPFIATAANFLDIGTPPDSVIGTVTFDGTVRSEIEKALDLGTTDASIPTVYYYVDTLRQFHLVRNDTGSGSLTPGSGPQAPYVISDSPTGAQIAADTIEFNRTTAERVTSVYVKGAEGIPAGSGWVRDSAAIAAVGFELHAQLEQSDSDTAAKRDAYGQAFLNDHKESVGRGQFTITGYNGWEVGQDVTITNVALGLSSSVMRIVGVETEFLLGTGLRRYMISFTEPPTAAAGMSLFLTQRVGRLLGTRSDGTALV
jgi:hypothetical protein